MSFSLYDKTSNSCYNITNWVTVPNRFCVQKNEEGVQEIEDKIKTEAVTKETKPAAKAKKRKKTSKDYAVEFFLKIAITAAVVVILCFFVVGIHVNHGNSSYPMIKDGDLVITYRIGKLEAGEEIAYKVDGQTRFGRISAVGGDVVDISGEYLKVNDYGITEDVVFPTTSEGAKISFPYTVPEDSLFVMNDLRKDINDSRTYGAIPRKDCEGKVVLVLRLRGI